MTPLLLLASSLLACTGDPAGADSGVATPGADKPALWPFPSAHLVGSDGQFDLPDSFPMVDQGTPVPVDRLSWRSGFSVVQTTAIDPEVALDPASLPGPADLATPGSVQLWDLTDGRRLPAFAELDAWCSDVTDDPACAEEVPTLLVRPLQPMPVGHHVAVVVTDQVLQADGSPWTGPAWYRDLVAGHPATDLVDWEAHYLDLESQLADLGVQGIVFTVDFPVGDGTQPTRSIVAQTSVPDAWSFYSTLSTDDGDTLPGGTWKRAQGRFTVDNWLVDDLMFDLVDGLPQAAGTAEADLYVHIPSRVASIGTGNAPVWIFGHGIFSQPGDYLADDEDSSAMIELADRAGAIVIATTWRGLTYTDLPTAIGVGSDFGRFPELTDKLAQGVANTVALRRLITEGGLLDDPVFEGRADPERLRYHGISLGGIEGAVLMAVDPAIPHGVLHVGGSTWSTMLERSSNWPQFEALVSRGIPSPRDRQLLYALSQLFWDEADPAGFAEDLRDRSALWQESMGDEQVPNITTESLMRGVGATLLQPAVELPPAITAADGPLTGPAFAQFDPELGRPDMVNRPAPVTGAHGTPRQWEGAILQTLRFLDPSDPGVVQHFCGDAPCTASNTGAE